MKYYIFIFSDTRKNGIHVGYCRDILKVIESYRKLPLLLFSPEKLNILVHLEIADNEQDAKQRFDEIFKMTLAQKHECILSQNPSWIEIIIGQHIEI